MKRTVAAAQTAVYVYKCLTQNRPLPIKSFPEFRDWLYKYTRPFGVPEHDIRTLPTGVLLDLYDFRLGPQDSTSLAVPVLPAVYSERYRQVRDVIGLFNVKYVRLDRAFKHYLVLCVLLYVFRIRESLKDPSSSFQSPSVLPSACRAPRKLSDPVAR